MIFWKSLPVLALLAACTSPQFAQDVQSPAYLAQEARYTADAHDLTAYAKDHPGGGLSGLVAADGNAYSALVKARTDHYSAASLAALDAALTSYEAALTSNGAKGYGNISK